MNTRAKEGLFNLYEYAVHDTLLARRKPKVNRRRKRQANEVNGLD